MIDLVLVLVALLAVWLGWRRGLVTSALTAVGWIAGLLLGLAATPAVLDALDLRPEADNTAALVVVLAALLLAAIGAGVMGALAGVVVRLTNVRPVRLLDSGLGAVALLVTTLLASWAVLASARPLLSADGVRAVDSSYGWRAMDRAAPRARATRWAGSVTRSTPRRSLRCSPGVNLTSRSRHRTPTSPPPPRSSGPATR
ncbi:CvpA family protein [Barrientosiimonas endolithica]|nr:CvpA family protein [Barrientosiimonas endolithica]